MTITLYNGVGQPYKAHHHPRSYTEAVRVGQRTYGYGNFYVDTGDYVPSREEQLLQVKSPGQSSRKYALENL